MSAKYFLDTNVFVYTFDNSQASKRSKARELIGEALQRGCGITSFQVVQEFLNVATRKFARPLTHSDARIYLDEVLSPLCEVFPTIELYRDTLGLADRWKYSFFDSLIIAAGRAGACDVLYSEDLQHGQNVEGITILNPFVPS